MQKYRTLFAATLAAIITLPALAESEGGLVTSLEAEKKISKKWSVGLGAELRTRNDFKTLDRWKFGIEGSYKINKYLKADAGYDLLDYNNREKVEYYTSSGGNAKIKWRPSYWGIRHRFHVSLEGDYKFSCGIKVSLRERWQYAYRPETAATRYKMDISDQTMALDEDYVRSSKSKHTLRSKLQVEYDRKGALFTPYLSAELFNGWKTEKVRYTVGTDINVSKQHVFNVFYRYQKPYDTSDSDYDYDPDMHYIGIGYKYKF